MTFLQAIAETVREAKRSGKRIYLYRGADSSEWLISFRYWSDWVFNAYPGGRTALSMDGEELAREAKNIEQKTLNLLSPSPGKCPQCATEHLPEAPHNQQSMFYQSWFHQQYGRQPTWADALAHCAPEVQQAWYAKLESRGIDMEGNA